MGFCWGRGVGRRVGGREGLRGSRGLLLFFFFFGGGGCCLWGLEGSECIGVQGGGVCSMFEDVRHCFMVCFDNYSVGKGGGRGVLKIMVRTSIVLCFAVFAFVLGRRGIYVVSAF